MANEDEDTTCQGSPWGPWGSWRQFWMCTSSTIDMSREGGKDEWGGGGAKEPKPRKSQVDKARTSVARRHAAKGRDHWSEKWSMGGF